MDVTFGQLMESQIICGFNDFCLIYKGKIVLNNVIRRPLSEDVYKDYYDYPVSSIRGKRKNNVDYLQIWLKNKEDKNGRTN